MKSFMVAAALLAQASGSSVSIARTCTEPDICYSLNIPSSTADSGTGDIFFQISASTSYQWIGLGQGGQMAGANIFVMYSSADGKNVTVSPRLGVGEVEPLHDTAASITLLAGSGISNGMMTANVKCSNCNQWSGGSMDFESSSAEWIQAFKRGTPLNSDDLSLQIVQHDEHGPFSWNLQAAKGGDSANPFASATTCSTDASGATACPSAVVQSGTPVPASGSVNQPQPIVTAHGILAALAFVVLFPTGGIVIRLGLGRFSGVVWVHAALQMLGYTAFIIAFALGLWTAILQGQLSDYHPIIGLVIFAILCFQPVIGLVHHSTIKKTGKKSFWTYTHLVIGRIAIILGIINGAFGLMLAANASTGDYAVYGVFAGLFGIAYLATAAFGVLGGKETSREGSQDGEKSREDESPRDNGAAESI